jgi:hypothetical protein
MSADAMKHPIDKEAVYAQIVADTERLGIAPFEPNAMADCLMTELEGQWDHLPQSTRNLLIGCVASLKKQHADGVIAEHRAFETVRKLRHAGEGA